MMVSSLLGFFIQAVLLTNSALATRLQGDRNTILAALPSTTCPCTLTISIPHDDFIQPQRPLDILVSKTNSNSIFETDASLSRFNYTSTHATARDALFLYHEVLIDEPSEIQVHVRQRAAANPSRAFINVQRQGKRCPVILGNPNETPSPAPSSAVETSQRIGRLSATTRQRSNPRIVGGQPASSELANYLAYIRIPSSDGVRACSGTVIGRRLVLTAAHCGTSTTSTVYVGAKQGSPADGIPFSVESVKNHELFKQSNSRQFRFDVALIILSGDVPDSIQFMSVNVNESVPVEKSIVRAAGYGILSHRNQYSNPNAQLYHVDIPIVPRRSCENAYGAEGVDVNYGFQVCAGYFGRGGCDSCQGDSGGPLFQYDAVGTPVIVGIVSIGVECANAYFPGVYVRTSAHKEFFPTEGVTRSKDAIAVFSDFVPVTVIRKETIIIVVTGGALVLIAVLFLGYLAVSKWKGKAAVIEAIPPPSPRSMGGPLLSPGESTMGSQRPQQEVQGDSNEDVVMMNQLTMGWPIQAPNPEDRYGAESQHMMGTERGMAASSMGGQHPIVATHLMNVGGHVYETFDPYDHQLHGGYVAPTQVIAQPIGPADVQAQLETYPSLNGPGTEPQPQQQLLQPQQPQQSQQSQQSR